MRALGARGAPGIAAKTQAEMRAALDEPEAPSSLLETAELPEDADGGASSRNSLRCNSMELQNGRREK